MAKTHVGSLTFNIVPGNVMADYKKPAELLSAGQELMQHLGDDHRHISVILDHLELALTGPEDDDVDWDLVSDMIDYLQEYPDIAHHPLEDQLFDRVLDKGLTPVERELIHLNMAQHVDISGATDDLASDVDRILSDIVVPIERLHGDFQRYLDLQRTHMINEDTHLYPLAQRLLKTEDWKDLLEASNTHTDPMFDLKQGKFASLYDFVTGST